MADLEENDPPLDLTRENAAFERERARLVRDYLGQIAVIHGDEVVGAYPRLYEARWTPMAASATPA